MDCDDIINLVTSWKSTVVLIPGPESGAPEIAWGDVFFYYSPDGSVPATQPFATIVTKNYPDDTASQLDRPGVFRVNIAPGRDEAASWASESDTSDENDPSELDHLFTHPVYGALGWVAVLNPGPRTTEPTRTLLHTAYVAARNRYERRHSTR